MSSRGKVSIGKIKYEGGKAIYPEKEGYVSIVIMMKSHSKWYPLSPYFLKDEDGYILENLWQFSKCYRKVPKSIQRYSRYDPTVIWEYPEETHLDEDGNPNKNYYRWRLLGFNNYYAVRYPVGYNYRKGVLFSIDKEGKRHNYIEARKAIYVPEYVKAAKKTPQFAELRGMLEKGTNLLICEVDGPHQECVQYYHDKYGTPLDMIEGNCVDAKREYLDVFLNDDKHPYGHGYCLAGALLDEES